MYISHFVEQIVEKSMANNLLSIPSHATTRREFITCKILGLIRQS
jgi:hypothetical protein